MPELVKKGELKGRWEEGSDRGRDEKTNTGEGRGD